MARYSATQGGIFLVFDLGFLEEESEIFGEVGV